MTRIDAVVMARSLSVASWLLLGPGIPRAEPRDSAAQQRPVPPDDAAGPQQACPDPARSDEARVAPAPAATDALDLRLSAGDPSAPVVLVLYVSGSGRSCAELVPSLYREVSAGRLKGKARLLLRPYSPDDSDDSVAVERALVAAANQGMLWPYLLRLCEQPVPFAPRLLRKLAYSEGLDICAFEVAYDLPETTALLEAIRQQGARDRVDTVPSAFIDGRRVAGELSTEAMVGFLQEAYVRAATQKPPP